MIEYLASKSFVPKSAATVSAEEAAKDKAVSDAENALEAAIRTAMPEAGSSSMSFADVVNLARTTVSGGGLLRLSNVQRVMKKLATEWHPGGQPSLEEKA